MTNEKQKTRIRNIGYDVRGKPDIRGRPLGIAWLPRNVNRGKRGLKIQSKGKVIWDSRYGPRIGSFKKEKV